MKKGIKRYILRLDNKVLFSIQKLRNPVMDMIMKLISKLGNGGFVWIVLSIFLLVTVGLKQAFPLPVVLVASVLVNNIIMKSLFDRERPCDIYKEGEPLIERPVGSSFPSGHTSSSFARAIVLGMMYPQAAVWVFLFAGLMGFSRTYLFVHFPLDVFFGAITGIIIGVLTMTIITIL